MGRKGRGMSEKVNGVIRETVMEVGGFIVLCLLLLSLFENFYNKKFIKNETKTSQQWALFTDFILV